MPSGALAPQRLLEPEGRQSLVTPIDWKLTALISPRLPTGIRRQSLVTPIDWKRPALPPPVSVAAGRQSLVTPIDWKLIKHRTLNNTIGERSPILGDAY